MASTGDIITRVAIVTGATLAVALLIAYAPDGTQRNTPITPPRDTWPRVSRAGYGDEWPFTIDGGTIQCEQESRRSARLFVTLDAGNGIHYGLNGSAISFGFPDGREILKPGRVPADMQPFIKRGLTLC